MNMAAFDFDNDPIEGDKELTTRNNQNMNSCYETVMLDNH